MRLIRQFDSMTLPRALPAVILALLIISCARPPLPPPPDPAFAALGLKHIIIGPVAYATYQPNEMCSVFIDEELRSAVGREVRSIGYPATAVGNSVPRSFAAGTPAPTVGAAIPVDPAFSQPGEGVLLTWIDEYWENTLCGWEGPKYLTMGAVAILYAGSPPREVWRGQARVAEQGDYAARDLIWLTTSRLSDQLLVTLPAGPGYVAPR